MKPFLLLFLFMMVPFLSGCSSLGGQGENLFQNTLDDLKKEGITFDKDALLDLFRFFWQVKKDYQSMSLVPEHIRDFSRNCYKRAREKCSQIKAVKIGSS